MPARATACPSCGSREVAWKARYRGPDGQERSKSFDRKLDADHWLDTEQADVVRGSWTDPRLGRMTLEEWLPRWEAAQVDLRPTTRALNVGVARNYLLPRFGRWPLAGIATSDVRAMVREEMDAGELSNSAIRRHVLVLSSVLGAAVDDGRIARNPCAGVKLPPENAREMRFLEPAEVAALAPRPSGRSTTARSSSRPHTSGCGGESWPASASIDSSSRLPAD